jgi:hypothetical protein
MGDPDSEAMKFVEDARFVFEPRHKVKAGRVVALDEFGEGMPDGGVFLGDCVVEGGDDFRFTVTKAVGGSDKCVRRRVLSEFEPGRFDFVAQVGGACLGVSWKEKNRFDRFWFPKIAISFGSEGDIHGFAMVNPVLVHPLLAFDVGSADGGDHFLRDQCHVALDA